MTWGESVNADEPSVNVPDPDVTLLPDTERTTGTLSGLFPTDPVTVIEPVYKPLARLFAFTVTVDSAEPVTLILFEFTVSHGVLPGLAIAALTVTGELSLDEIESA